MTYTANVKISLSSQFNNTVPLIELKINGRTTQVISVSKTLELTFETMPQPKGDCTISIVFVNKDYKDTANHTKDMIVNINKVTVQGYDYDFSKHSVYRPIYPEPWAQQQLAAGNVLLSEIHSNCLGWNGEWQLKLEMPVYRWIHKTSNLGWLI